jgi:glycosyltransferase involved in cell wall biosynthesis
MRSRPLVTVAIPTYNRANGYLRQALESALGQTYENLEILVSDNCSTDETATLVHSLSDSRIRYVRHPVNMGANNNFNFCIQEARGKYFLFLHDDDLIDPEFVEICVRAASKVGECGLVRTGTRIIDGEGKLVREVANRVEGLSTEEFFLGWFGGQTAFYLCSTLFDTEKLRMVGGFNSKHNLFQDVIAEVKLAAHYGRTDVPEVKATFRVHGAELSFARGLREWCEDSFQVLDLMCELAPSHEAQLREKGMRFFARGNYHRASAVKSRWKRLRAYLTVWRMYGYRQWPSFRMLLSRTIAYRSLRLLKVTLERNFLRARALQ